MSFINERVQPEGLTFDDVLLIPAYSEVLPREVNVQTRFSRNISLNIPIVSAAMDTVTEAPLAIALAREGGIGVIHKNMSIAEQAAQVRKVKRAENGMIYDPVTISKDHTVGDALNLMKENKIGGIPVVDADRMLIGIVTNRDLRFQRDMSRRIEEVMTPGDRLVTTHNPELSHAQEILLNSKIEKLPVVDDAGRLVGLITYKDITKVQDHPNACKDAKGRLRVAAGVGVTPDAMDRVKALVAEDVDAVVLDSAHGHSANIVSMLKRIKEVYPSLDVVVGNIATGGAARYLIENGADGVKVGIGPGSICTTRIIAGVGVPQLTAIYDVACVARESGVPVIADGGLRYSGDLVKALAAGGDCVMIGSMFAGTEEAPGETIIRDGLPAHRRRPFGHGLLRREGHRDAQAGPVHPHHGFGHAGEPSARRSHHERGAQLFERTVDGTPGFEIRLVDSGGGVRTVRRMADHPPSGAAYAGPCGGVGLSSPARVGGLSKFWKVIERLIWKKS